MPIIEWISTATNHINIAKYLSSAKQIFDENKIPYPKVVVTDQGWALVNATLLSFNHCNLPNYLNWCFLILI